jgi:YD repeat-containing protein
MLIRILLPTLLLLNLNLNAQNFKYDNLGRVVEISYPDSTISRYIYDANGNRISQVTTTPIVPKTSNPDTSSDIKLLVFPNPTPGTITVSLELGSPDDIAIACYTLDGKLILKERHKNIQTLTKSYRLDGKARGNYYFIIYTSQGKNVWKVEKL